MPIEFRCSRCGKLLRTGDGTAGRQAQCPQCGTIGTVPGGAAPQEPLAPMPPPLGGEGPSAGGATGSPFGPGAAPAAVAEAPYQPSSPPGYQSPPGQAYVYSDAAQRVSGSATALIVIGWLGTIYNVLVTLGGVLFLVAMTSRQAGAMHGDEQAQVVILCVGCLVGGVVGTVLGILILIGARRMKRLESYGFAMTAAIIALIPCVSPCGLLSLPFGIWALVVLLDNSVKAAFRS